MRHQARVADCDYIIFSLQAGSHTNTGALSDDRNIVSGADFLPPKAGCVHTPLISCSPASADHTGLSSAAESSGLM